MAIYLDYNATAPLRPEVCSRMAELLGAPANPSSAHRFGRAAKKHLEDARKTIAEYISAFPNEIIFTACATEANATALRGMPGRRVLVSAIEHSSVLKEAGDRSRVTDKNFPDTCHLIPVTSAGVVNLEVLDRMLEGGPPALVSIMLANNETGIVQPIADAAALCKKHGALLHTDAVQALGKIPLDFTALGADMMTIAAHKMGGPVGVAALVVRQDLSIAPLLTGGGQELRRRAGTENIAAIGGFARAVELMDFAHMQKLRGWLDAMERQLTNVGATIFPSTEYRVPSTRLPNTSCLAIPALTQEVLLMKLDLAGFAVSAGSACSSGRIEPSHVLLAMGVEKALAGSAIRISGGWATTQQEIEKLTEALLESGKLGG
ncbi:MAG: cysteine desulfurase family protein [Alphaproteobacteria bacterium]|nr:cysteine desulfurase family protein [Alphaproteobacteria bacterium]